MIGERDQSASRSRELERLEALERQMVAETQARGYGAISDRATESGEGARHRRSERAGRITTVARELVDLPFVIPSRTNSMVNLTPVHSPWCGPYLQHPKRKVSAQEPTNIKVNSNLAVRWWMAEPRDQSILIRRPHT
jgi:hypothetical protein